jgi:mono/diheme cytochrome c family protein
MKKLMNGLAIVVISFSLAGTIFAGGAETWEKKCAMCHGKDAKGKTKMCEKFKCKDLTDPKVQGALTDDDLFHKISDGIKDASGKQSMPAYRDKLTEDEIREVVKFIRTLKAK